jgi:hypothetical protein
VAKQASQFWRVGLVIEMFVKQGCELRVAEQAVQLEDGDCLNARYLLNPTSGAFVPLVDLTDEQQVSELEVAFWERRLGVAIPRKRDNN